ncbi:cytochrome family subfamily polypeptide 55 precursor [Stylonychia lemnae]|uniref:Cytochrome family subfamily polypeptide 55 n=1 Tax=Stylonychia lemnae TaxID=5949 RepID=A0A078AKC4_STYLE|nr:cytochrome family subfamily polypeptide 55 precursor [Stylonychia lemnae]|eukprot:CDW82654.1 cytochrome family subfamily polypeptide 55 precursor [Stylonychia lemnae]
MSKLTPYSKLGILEYWEERFGKDLPPIICDCRTRSQILIFSNPQLVEEIYTTKSKFMDKHQKFQEFLEDFQGHSSANQKSNQEWADKRKHLTSAFYKEKIIRILKESVAITYKKVQTWKERLNSSDASQQLIILNREIQELLDEVVNVSIFGQGSQRAKLNYQIKGKQTQMVPGQFARTLLNDLFKKLAHPLRLNWDFFNKIPLNSQERETRINCIRFREYVQSMIDERKKEMKEPGYIPQLDFLTMILQNPFFEGKDKVVIDECCTFFSASNVTSATTITNLLFFLIRNQDLIKKIRKECKRDLKVENFLTINCEQWQSLATYEALTDCNYLQYCIMETLRFETSIPVSGIHVFTEDTKIGEYMIKKETTWHINMNGLHFNKDEWIRPEEFNPDRFDPSNPLYLTPKGTKRHPMSFGPFLGGRRICLGKTFAESMIKCLSVVIINSIDFEFEDKDLLDRKPLNTFLLDEPIYLVRLKPLID